MSFDIFLQRFHNGISVAPDQAAIQAVISSRSHQGPDEFGCYIFNFDDGTEVELYVGGLDGTEAYDFPMFALRSFGIDAVKLILDCALAGEMTILPMMDKYYLILPDANLQAHLPLAVLESVDGCIICATAEELHAVLMGGYQGWRTFRDFVAGRHDGSFDPTGMATSH